MGDKVIGVDIGGTNIRVGLIDIHTFQVLKKDTALAFEFKTVSAFFKGIKNMIERVDAQKEAGKIGMALPIPWKDDMIKISDSTNLPLLEGMLFSDIKAFFPEYEVYFENDVNVIALLEAKHGASRGYEHSIYITVSTGIGSGMIFNQSIFRGTHGYAGEIGSMIISDENKNHLLLYNGTLESLCSGNSLNEESAKLYGEGATAKHLFEQYKSGDAGAVHVMEAWIDHFSSAIASLMQTIDPEIFVFGGSVIYHNQWLINEIIKSTENKVFEQLKDKVKIVLSKYGPDAGMIGAGYIAVNNTDEGER
ncbi:ROK family protein [Heyndrickxia acidicola]|uniref:ROK family protein n=1 Tax=Heyndrickxia acidicola TaxID=209389 RepID=A0ABU6MBK5_9BACI|nr:ROK family protein [Heyndrickxia acidicola]MED1201798.1 ROK family protein [Heyndrickxia acidicola]